MTEGFISLTSTQVLASLAVVALAIGLAWINRTALESQLLIGTIRSFLQLWLIGYVLFWLFHSENPWLIAFYAELMILIGVYTACQRQESAQRSTFFNLCIAMHISIILIGGFLLLGIFQLDPLANPHLFIPLAGMIIGNSANGAALAVHRLRSDVASHRGQIEAALLLGAPPKKAIEPYIVQTFRNALIQPINSMMLMGIVQLPGIMTGQILAGIMPQEAVRYQIVIVYTIVGTVMLTCHTTVWLETRTLFNKHWSLEP